MRRHSSAFNALSCYVHDLEYCLGLGSVVPLVGARAAMGALFSCCGRHRPRRPSFGSLGLFAQRFPLLALVRVLGNPHGLPLLAPLGFVDAGVNARCGILNERSALSDGRRPSHGRAAPDAPDIPGFPRSLGVLSLAGDPSVGRQYHPGHPASRCQNR